MKHPYRPVSLRRFSRRQRQRPTLMEIWDALSLHARGIVLHLPPRCGFGVEERSLSMPCRFERFGEAGILEFVSAPEHQFSAMLGWFER